MADIAFFAVGFIAGTYAGLVCKKNNVTVIPRTLDLGVYGAKGDIAKEQQVMLGRYL
jgi:hypothetical protein